MKYTILSIDDSRKAYTDSLKGYLETWDRVETDCVDGNDEYALRAAIRAHGYEIKDTWDHKAGQLGVIYSVLNALEHAPIITFEDDAILAHNFFLLFGMRYRALPIDFDFFSLFDAGNQRDRYSPELIVNEQISHTWASYGGVSMLYSKKGAERIKELLRNDGIWGQYDDMLYHYSDIGALKGYQSRADTPYMVTIAPVESLVHETPVFDLDY